MCQIHKTHGKFRRRCLDSECLWQILGGIEPRQRPLAARYGPGRQLLGGIGRHEHPLAAIHGFGGRVWVVILRGIGRSFEVVLGWYWVVLGGIGAHLMFG